MRINRFKIILISSFASALFGCMQVEKESVSQNTNNTSKCDEFDFSHKKGLQDGLWLNCPAAHFEMAEILKEGKHGIAKNYSEAVYYYQLAADQGIVEAQNNLGMMYLQGLGVQKDSKKAFHLFEQAALGGSQNAQNNLAIRYLKGDGISKDNEKALDFFYKAAQQGNGEAAFGLFKVYSEGLNGTPDEIKAYAWLKIASQSKAERITEFNGLLKQLNSVLTKSQIDQANKLAEELKKEILQANKDK